MFNLHAIVSAITALIVDLAMLITPAAEVPHQLTTPTAPPAATAHAPAAAQPTTQPTTVSCSTPVNVSRGPRLSPEAAYDLLLDASGNAGWAEYYRDVFLYRESGLYTRSVSPTCDFGWTQINLPSWGHLYDMTRVLYDAAYAAQVAWLIYVDVGNQWYGADVPMGARPY